MVFKLKIQPKSHSINVYVDPKTKYVDRDENDDIWLGGFYNDINGDLQFYQNESYLFDLEDIRLISQIAEQIIAETFKKIYDESESE